jgi:hypothetical protein
MGQRPPAAVLAWWVWSLWLASHPYGFFFAFPFGGSGDSGISITLMTFVLAQKPIDGNIKAIGDLGKPFDVQNPQA